MKMKHMIRLLSVTAFTGLLILQEPAFAAGNAAQAKKLKMKLQSAKAKISRILNSRSNVRPHFVLENDPPALSRLAEANIALEEAALLAEDAELAYSALDFNQGNYHFVKSCSQAAIARSRVARANLMANQPPVGWLMAFSADMGVVVSELTALKSDVGCP